MKRLTLLTAFFALALGVGSSSAAAPAWNLDIHHNETNFVPGSSGSISVSTQTQGSPPATNEVQLITVQARAGSFNLTFAGQTTPDLPFDASAAEVQAALRALSSIGSSNVTVTAGPGDVGGSSPYVVTFVGALAATDVAQLTGAPGSGNGALAGSAEYWFDVSNVGDAASSGLVTLTINLPTGITRNSVAQEIQGGSATWSCPGSAGTSTVTCTTSSPIPRHTLVSNLILRLNVAPSASGDRFAAAKISGGGAPAAPPAAGCAPGAGACAVELTHIDPNPAPFGVVTNSWAAGFFSADGVTPETEAGSHPDNATFSFDLNSVAEPVDNDPQRKIASESIRHLRVDLPPGFSGNLTAMGECTPAELTTTACPPSSQVGKATGSIYPATANHFYTFQTGVYNMRHPTGTLADLAFTFAGEPVHIKASLDPANNYSVVTTASDINETLPPFHSKVTIWGVPQDPVHDSERCHGVGNENIDTSTDCPSDGPSKPFLTTPFQCGADMAMTLRDYDPWQNSGAFGLPLTSDIGQFGGCDQIPFGPTVSVDPTTDAADSPSGLDVQLTLPQNEACEPGPPVDCGIATSPLRDATVTLPRGITVNPASANGLDACTPAQISLGTDTPVQCPDGSRVASAQVTTPLLPNPIKGVVYLASQQDNPFNSLLAGYIVLSDPDRGILVKIPGRIDVDAATGQLSGSFDDNPQLQFSELQLHFKGGAHSTLITPATCGTYTSSARFAPWSGTAPVAGTDSFAIGRSSGGGACAGSEAELPNSPGFDAGTVSPVSKSYSPFVLHLRRQDGTQRFGAFNVALPPGLTGKLAGTAICPGGALAAAALKSGRDEQASPSCPPASHVGEVVAATGAGPSPYYVKGDVYLAGPYKGAPVSLAVITPAVAGPFDLGTIVVLTPLRIDSRTAQITAVSDPIPQMLRGIPTDVRSIDVIMDRPQLTLTGTSCNPASVGGLLTSNLGQAVPLAVRYQLSDCTRLPFKPKMTLFLRGGAKRSAHPALTVVLQPRPGDANIASLSLAMPKSEFLDQGHIKTICTRVQFAADACPRAAVYGRATVSTPLLDYPLAGSVYLRSSDNLLPDLVPDLRGPSYQPIRLESAGRTDSVQGGLRSTFDFIPDAPFSRLVTMLPGGKKGLLVNSRDICERTYRATVKYTAHNGLRYVDHPELKVRCKRKRAAR